MEECTRHIVIARYNEPIDWVNTLPDVKTTKIYLYNKGGDDVSFAKQESQVTVATLPNVGRESHTYLTHIIDNYDKLDPKDVTFFTQGGLSTHAHGPIPKFIENTVSEALRIGINESRAIWHRLIPQHQARATFRISEWPPKTPVTPNARNENFGQWFERCLGRPIPQQNVFKWIAAGTFAVRNDRILKHPKAFYEMLIAEVNDCNNPETGHFFERSWYYIFQ